MNSEPWSWFGHYPGYPLHTNTPMNMLDTNYSTHYTGIIYSHQYKYMLFTANIQVHEINIH